MSSPLPQRSDSSVTLPLAEEHLEVSRERVETGAVRVRIVPEETTQPLVLDEWIDEAVVERVPVDRAVDARQAPWHDGDVLVVPVYEEVVVVQRQLRLKEEIRLHRRREHRVQESQVTLRREVVRVERRQPDGSWSADAAPPSGGV